MDFKKLNNELNEADINQFSASEVGSKRLTRQAGRKYVYSGPSVTRITRTDKRTLLKEKDPAVIKDAIENAFKIIIAAATNTSVQQIVISKINTMRTQIYARLDKEIAKAKESRDQA